MMAGVFPNRPSRGARHVRAVHQAAAATPELPRLRRTRTGARLPGGPAVQPARRWPGLRRCRFFRRFSRPPSIPGGFRFTGDVWAMAEGSPFLPNEPVLRVTAPLAQAQLVETALLAILNLQTTIASKAAAIVTAAGDRPVHGVRCAPGAWPGGRAYAARAAYLAGCTSTSFVEAGRRFGIPLSGTMAHSWILAAESERQAFTRVRRPVRAGTVLLLDTYDVPRRPRSSVGSGSGRRAVRLDSGDLLSLVAQVRRDLRRRRSCHDANRGQRRSRRMEDSDLIAADAPIDAYAVGTALTTSEDAPALGRRLQAGRNRDGRCDATGDEAESGKGHARQEPSRSGASSRAGSRRWTW